VHPDYKVEPAVVTPVGGETPSVIVRQRQAVREATYFEVAAEGALQSTLSQRGTTLVVGRLG